MIALFYYTLTVAKTLSYINFLLRTGPGIMILLYDRESTLISRWRIVDAQIELGLTRLPAFYFDEDSSGRVYPKSLRVLTELDFKSGIAMPDRCPTPTLLCRKF